MEDWNNTSPALLTRYSAPSRSQSVILPRAGQLCKPEDAVLEWLPREIKGVLRNTRVILCGAVLYNGEVDNATAVCWPCVGLGLECTKPGCRHQADFGRR